MESKKLKIGIIGTGNISHLHIAGYLHNKNTELYALCDINEERLKKAGEKYGISRLYTDKDEMLKSLPELDAVSVCTWNSAHAECSIAALRAGKHVLCEKPMAMNAQQALDMERAAAESGKLLMIGFVRRFGNDCRVIQDFIDGGTVGDIYYAKATYLRRCGCPGGWFGDKARSGGGPLIDLGVHVIDLCRYLAGNRRPLSVFGASFSGLDRSQVKTVKSYTASDLAKRDVYNVEDAICAMIRFEGFVLSVEASFALNIKKDVGKIELFGTKGGVSVDPEVEVYNVTNGYLTDISIGYPTALDFNGLFDNEIAHFADCLLGRCECRSPAHDGVEIMRIIDGIYESAKTGHEVVLG